jgi:integrin alpha 8
LTFCKCKQLGNYFIIYFRKQYQEQLIYDTNKGEIGQLSNETEIGPEIMHEFKIINNGPSQISLTELLISWQKQINIIYKQKDFLYLVENPYTEGPIKCEIESSLINPLNLSVCFNSKKNIY